MTVFSPSRFTVGDKQKTDHGLASVNGFGDTPFETMSSMSSSDRARDFGDFSVSCLPHDFQE